MITDRICAVVVSTMKVEELAEKGCGFGEHARAGEDVKEDGVREGMGTVMRVVCGEVEERETCGGVETETAEEGVGEVVGEFEGEILEGVGTVEN